MEPSHNIAGICKKHAKERLAKFQATWGDKPLPLPCFVKIPFSDKGKTEHMWVKVERHIQGNSYSGILDNDPVVVTHIKCGDTLLFLLNEVEELIV